MAKATKTQYLLEKVANGEYPEVGDFGTEGKAELQKFYKKLTTEQLEDWVSLEGLEVKETDSPAIYRMRLAMAILYLHYPKAPAKKKKESKYAKYSTEELVQMAIDKEVVFETTDDNRILRMRAIMALRAAKHID